MEQNLMQKAAYLKGLADGLEIDLSKKENKLLSAVIDLVDEMAFSVCELQDTTDEVENELDEIAEELLSIENELDCDCDCDDDDCDCEDGVYYEVECPTCSEHITVDESLVASGKIACPNCGESLEFEFDEDDEDCGCDCCH
ncbi:MAG: hypothetical protein RSC43_04850 [Clostridia bacterium]